MSTKLQLIRLLMLVLLFACAAPSLLRAEEGFDEEFEDLALFYAEQDLIYSVSKRAEPFMEAPSAVYTITADDIKYSGAKKITDALRMIPGLDVADVNSFYTGVQARGFSFFPKFARQMLVLIDGRSVYSPQINATFWDQLPLFLEDIERIEVIHGPNAALYGANAFNGVINIITKPLEKTEGAFVSLTAGSRSSQWNVLRYGGSVDKLSYRVTGGYHESEGFDRVDDRVRKPMVTGRGDYTIDDSSRLIFEGGYVGGERELSRTVEPHVDSYFGMLKYEKQMSLQNSFSLQAYHDYRKSEMVFGMPDELWEDDVELQFSRQAERYDLVFGGGYRRDHVRHGFLSGRQYDEFAIKGTRGLPNGTKTNNIFKTFVNCTYHIRDNVLLTGALMVENNDFVGTIFSPKAALVYLPSERHSLRLGVARAYRTPSFIERYADFSVPAPPGFDPLYIGQAGNRDLDPERMMAYELGYRGKFLNDALLFNVETFYHSIDDIIVYMQDDPGIYRYRNYTSNHVCGATVFLQWQVRHWWRLTMSYTYQKGSDDYLKGLIVKNKWKLGSRFMLPWGITANAQFYFVDDCTFKQEAWVAPGTVDAYTRLDVRISKRFMRDRAEIAVIGQNLLDPRHYEYPMALSAGAAPRTFYVELTFRYGK